MSMESGSVGPPFRGVRSGVSKGNAIIKLQGRMNREQALFIRDCVEEEERHYDNVARDEDEVTWFLDYSGSAPPVPRSSRGRRVAGRRRRIDQRKEQLGMWCSRRDVRRRRRSDAREELHHWQRKQESGEVRFSKSYPDGGDTAVSFPCCECCFNDDKKDRYDDAYMCCGEESSSAMLSHNFKSGYIGLAGISSVLCKTVSCIYNNYQGAMCDAFYDRVDPLVDTILGLGIISPDVSLVATMRERQKRYQEAYDIYTAVCDNFPDDYVSMFNCADMLDTMIVCDRCPATGLNTRGDGDLAMESYELFMKTFAIRPTREGPAVVRALNVLLRIREKAGHGNVDATIDARICVAISIIRDVFVDLIDPDTRGIEWSSEWVRSQVSYEIEDDGIALRVDTVMKKPLLDMMMQMDKLLETGTDTTPEKGVDAATRNELHVWYSKVSSSPECAVFKTKQTLFRELGCTRECGVCYESKLNIDLCCGHLVCTSCYLRLYDTLCPFCRIRQEDLAKPDVVHVSTIVVGRNEHVVLNTDVSDMTRLLVRRRANAAPGYVSGHADDDDGEVEDEDEDDDDDDDEDEDEDEDDDENEYEEMDEYEYGYEG